MTDGLIAAFTTAVGVELTRLAGFRSTRLTSALAAGAQVAAVESTYDWGASGTVVIDGVRYAYSSKTASTLVGLTHQDDGAVVAGAKMTHAVRTEVVDFSRTYSELDKLRRDVLVASATGDYLSRIGRNLGVQRPPELANDDTFRAVVQSLGYAPRGTLFALELALDAFFGAGQYELWESLKSDPCTVFVRLNDALALDTDTLGKTYQTRVEQLLYETAGNTLTTTETPTTIAGVRFADELYEGDFRLQKPSADTDVRFVGDAGLPVWVFSGTDELSGVTVTAADGGACRFYDGAALTTVEYVHAARVIRETQAYFEVHAKAVNLDSMSDGRQFTLHIRDGERDIAVGFFLEVTGLGGRAVVAFIDATTGADISPRVSLGDVFGEWHTVAVRKQGADEVELIVNGVVAATLAHASFAASAAHEFRFGCGSTTLSGADVHVKTAAFFAETLVDFWNERGTGGSVATASPTRFATGSGTLQAGDVGKPFRVAGGTVQNAEGGNNNGFWKVSAFVDSSTVELVGETDLAAFVESGHQAKVEVAGHRPFRYPDDKGKRLELLDGAGAGTYTIVHILDEATGFPLDGASSETSNAVLVVGGTTGVSGANGRVETTVSDLFTDLDAGGAFTDALVGDFLLIRQATNPVNAGVFRIVDVVDANTLAVVATGIGQPFTTESALAWEIRQGTDFVTATALSWRLVPVFTTESGLTWELSGSGALAGNVATLRSDPPIDSAVMRVSYATMLSGQLLPGRTTAAVETTPGALSYYPFYLPASPLGAFAAFLDDLTAAGIIAELSY